MSDSSGKTINSLKGPFIALILVVIAYYGWVGLKDRGENDSNSKSPTASINSSDGIESPTPEPAAPADPPPELVDPMDGMSAMLQEPEITQSDTIPPAYEPNVGPISDGTDVSAGAPVMATDMEAEIDSESASRSAQFESTMTQVQQKIQRKEFSEALTQLSPWYDSPGLTDEQRERLLYCLNGLGYSVIFSQKHLLEGPYRVSEGETLQSIAVKHNVPWELLAAINMIPAPYNLTIGQTLKVVNGPFDAVIDLSDHYLTVLLKGRYATRFPIDYNPSQFAPPEGTYFVNVRFLANPHPEDGQWIGLKSQSGDIGAESSIGIHGIDHYATRDEGETWAPVRLDEKQIRNLYIILAEGSRVVVRP